MTSKENKQGLFDSLGRASVMGLHMVFGHHRRLLLGYWLDKWFGTIVVRRRWLIVGIGAGFRNIWLDARILLRQGEQDDAGKKAAKITARSIGWRRGCGGAACRTHDPGNLVLAAQRHCLVPVFRRGALAVSPGGGVDLLVWLRSTALRMEFFCLTKICSQSNLGWLEQK